MRKSVFIIDDSSYMRSLIKGSLEKAGYRIVGEAGNGKLAIDLCIRLKPDLITLDSILPDMQGLDILQALRKESINSKVIMVTAMRETCESDEAITLGAVHCIVKPFEPKKLVGAINQMFDKQSA